MKTTSYKYDGGAETEFVFCCKGRPFTAMVASHLQTPETLLDYKLVKDLGLKLTDIQCQRFSMGGHKMRIMGHVKANVQTVLDGFVGATFQLKAKVVLDLYNCLDTFSICGSKMADMLMPGREAAATAVTAGAEQAADADAVATPVRGPRSPSSSPKPKRARPGAAQSPLKTMCSPPAPVTPPRSTPSHSSATDPAAPSPPQDTEPAMARSPPRTPTSHGPKPRMMSPRSPPGYPTPMMMRIQGARRTPPRCLRVKEEFPEEHPLTANLTVLENTFLGAERQTPIKERLLLMDTFPDASFMNTPDGQLRMETPDGLRYWSDHGENRCTPNCFQLYGGGPTGVPNNCGWHKQWMFPVGFKLCGYQCSGAFCGCLDYYDY